MDTAQGQTVGDAARSLREEFKIADVLQRMTAVTLRKNGAELCGPCPKCGDGGKGERSDRFYVTQDGKACACRQCHTQRMDVTGFVAWLHGVSQHEALDMLRGRRTFARVRPAASSPAPTATATETEKPNASNSQTWRTDAARRVQKACERLHADSSGARDARQYLLSRGIQPETWQAFSLGYEKARVPGTEDYRPAVSWPVVHEETGETYGVRYRFLEAQPGADGKEHRYTSLTGTRTGGRLFGVPALPTTSVKKLTEVERSGGRLFGVPALPTGVLLPWDNADRLHGEAISCLVITEGEFNSMSVWQACHETNVDVLSFGSESQRTLPAWAVTIAQRYGAVVVWVDSADKALQVAQQLPQARALRSVTEDGAKQDANALLVQGQLGGLIQAARLSVMRERRESVLWQLWDARDTLDAGQRIVGQSLAHELGKNVTF
jgi:hypothetical protein